MPGRRVGEYELRSVITTGPWGGVYEAEHPAFGRVALEVLASRFGRIPEQARRFREGGERLAGLRDEAIQRVLEVGYGGERHFIAREPLLGEPASRLLAERGPFEPAEAFRIAMRVAGALEVTHRAGLRHGAVRPSNLILDIARDRVTLVGFLFALPDVSPESGLAADASWYVAPEELRWGRPGDARGDVYALALVTFELCAGQNPFRGELGDMVRKKLATPPPSLCALRSDVPPVADQILGQALSPDPEHRFASAAAFAQALRHAFRAAPPQPPPRRATPAPLPPQAAPYQQRSGTPWPPVSAIQALPPPAPPRPAAGAPPAPPRPGSPTRPGPTRPGSGPLPAVRPEDPRAPRTLCIACERPVQDADPVCPHCGARRAAPPCPRCGAPVTSAMSRRVIQEHERGYYPWHAGWNGRCEACGFDFAMSVQAEPGHYGLVGQGASPTEIEIRGGESVYTSFDSWEHQPTVEIRLKRQLASNAGSGEGRLGTEASIVLTPAEWTAIARALSGPLRVLLDRPRWTRDRT